MKKKTAYAYKISTFILLLLVIACGVAYAVTLSTYERYANAISENYNRVVEICSKRNYTPGNIYVHNRYLSGTVRVLTLDR